MDEAIELDDEDTVFMEERSHLDHPDDQFDVQMEVSPENLTKKGDTPLPVVVVPPKQLEETLLNMEVEKVPNNTMDPDKQNEQELISLSEQDKRALISEKVDVQI